MAAVVGYRARMFYITNERPGGYVVLSEASQWVPWLARNIPKAVHVDVRRKRQRG